MAIRKVCGIETEYGILLRGAGDSNPMAASSVLINSYVAQLSRRIGWDFEDESPGRDARGFLAEGALPPDVETHLVNAVLTNGARYYVDHAHPEISTPECADARETVVFDKAAEEIVRQSMLAAQRVLPPGGEVIVHKNNSDGKGNCYGCHENYLMAREVPFGRIVAQVTPHFVTRQIYCGAGKVGCEAPGVSAEQVPFQLSQRADFFEEEVGLETTLKRPIVNTRDEPHCDSQKYRRLHVIVGDANLSEVATFLKVGTTSIVLAMIEDDVLPADMALERPVASIKDVSPGPHAEAHDPHPRRPAGHRPRDPVAAARARPEVRARARAGVRRRGGRGRGAAALGGGADRPRARPVGARQPARLGGQGAPGRRLPRAPRARMDRRPPAGHRPAVPRPAPREVAVRDGPAWTGSPPTTRSTRAMTEPPDDTRAYFRGRCLQKWPNDIVAANWDSLVFDVGCRPASPGADDGAAAWNGRPCG